jgi:hypothetical protein
MRVDGRFFARVPGVQTINNLTSQAEHVVCFTNAAAHLAPGGRLVIEVSVPQLQRVALGESDFVFDRSDPHLGVDELDPLTQRMVSHHYSRREDGSFELRSSRSGTCGRRSST